MEIITVTMYNEFAPCKPENSRIVYKGEFEAKSFTEAFDKAERLARRWNKAEKRENMIVHFISTKDTVRAIY